MSGWRGMATNCRNRTRGCRLSTKNCASRPAINSYLLVGLILAFCRALVVAQGAPNPTALSWDQVKGRFESANPTLKADAINVDEMKAQEITAFLRPNPQFTLSSDGTQLAPHGGVWQPTKGTQLQTNFSYLHE